MTRHSNALLGLIGHDKSWYGLKRHDKALYRTHCAARQAAHDALLQQEEGAQQESPPPLGSDAIFAGRQALQQMPVSDTVEKYIVDLVMATRNPEGVSAQLTDWIAVGSSPRASIALHRASRAEAWLQGRDHVLPEDVRTVVPPVLRHRLILSYDAIADGVDTEHAVSELLAMVAVG